MIAPLTLIGLAFVLAFVGPVLLRRAGWLERAPVLGIIAWQGLTGALLLAVVLAAAALAIPAIPWTTDLAEFFRACAMALRAQYSTPGGVVVSATGAVAAILVLGRVAYFVAAGLRAAALERRRHRDMLAVASHSRLGRDVVVVDHASAAAYCLAGRTGQIVVTTAAISTLDAAQLDAVLAHERAHLRARHHLVLALSAALCQAFPGVPTFQEAHTSLARLVEMHADDTAAARGNDRLAIASALVRLSEHGATPAAALGAGGTTALGRVRRLVAPARPLGRRRVAATIAATVALIALPLMLAVAPASAAATMPPCPADGTLSTTM